MKAAINYFPCYPAEIQRGLKAGDIQLSRCIHNTNTAKLAGCTTMIFVTDFERLVTMGGHLKVIKGMLGHKNSKLIIVAINQRAA